VNFNIRRLSRVLVMRPIFVRHALIVGFALLSARVPLAIGAPQSPAPAKDARETAAFFETLVNSELAVNHVPGAVVVLVKNGELLFSAGYGYADIAAKRRVTPDSTIFPLGSIAESVTATALMKLVEEGKLHLGDDVDHCLRSFRIDHSMPQPVKIIDLLTHTGGFEEEPGVRRASAGEIPGRAHAFAGLPPGGPDQPLCAGILSPRVCRGRYHRDTIRALRRAIRFCSPVHEPILISPARGLAAGYGGWV